MHLEFQAWFKKKYPHVKNDKLEWIDEWRMAEVKSIHLGTNKVIIPISGGNQSFTIGDNCILRQYINVQDDNGNKLFTGDVVVVWNTLTETSKPYRAVIEWDKYRFAFKAIETTDFRNSFPYQNADTFGLSVKEIGNIYENPELMN